MEVTNKFENDYKSLLIEILKLGYPQKNRTGIIALTSFGKKISFDFKANPTKMPVITGKKIFYNKAYYEFLWMWKGRSDTAYLKEHGIEWWNEYADDSGWVNKSYGHQLRFYNNSFDQIQYALQEIEVGSRRAYITFWNPTDIKDQVLPCCYTGMNFVRIGNVLNMEMSFRSSDVFLGLPYDFIVGALFLRLMSEISALVPGKIVYSLSNAHIYYNHTEQVEEYLKLPIYDLPTYNQTAYLTDYQHGPLIKAELNN